MPTYPYDLIHKYQSKGVLVDTNLLLLLAIGNYSKDRIETCKRTRQFTREDYELLCKILASFRTRITTANILTETDNLARQGVSEREYEAVSTCLRNIINDFFEVHGSSKTAAANERYATLGLADCVTLISDVDVLVLTDDRTLSDILTFVGRDALNINHLRHFKF